ncbi:MAG: sigma-70 family RNA polymerase sigma factor [bacterium]|nr:sigma-70 family RNA polymerase sigma factor [bacterium]
MSRRTKADYGAHAAVTTAPAGGERLKCYVPGVTKREAGSRIEAARAGNAAAIEELLATHADRIFRFGLDMCRHEEDAREVAQETMFAAARALPEFRGESSVSSWLYSIARRFCGRMRRHRSGAPAQFGSLDSPGAVDAVDESAPPMDEAVDRRRVDSWIRAAMEDLDEGQRAVFVLRDLEGLAASEVAAALDLSIPAVKSRLHRARGAIRERLAPLL